MKWASVEVEAGDCASWERYLSSLGSQAGGASWLHHDCAVPSLFTSVRGPSSLASCFWLLPTQGLKHSFLKRPEEEPLSSFSTWGLVMLSNGVWLCVYAQSCLTFGDPMGYSPPGSLSLGFSRQEYWSGLPFPPPGDLPDPGIDPHLL